VYDDIGYVTDYKGDPMTNGIHESHDVIWMHRMFYKKDIGQDIAIPPMIIPGIDDTTSAVTQEGTGLTGTASILTREGEAHKLDNMAVPAVLVPDNVPDAGIETRTRTG
jgi:hypothetical protein